MTGCSQKAGMCGVLIVDETVDKRECRPNGFRVVHEVIKIKLAGVRKHQIERQTLQVNVQRFNLTR